ncbi:hypothetical protein RI129_003203 [Pyrocoelia pectoralis]|uniref:Uncharacterized protein n=1 Tax=Pyrocoelia pectoralis TaxID=417401 RepID=A0AAN7VNI0_9COLE
MQHHFQKKIKMSAKRKISQEQPKRFINSTTTNTSSTERRCSYNLPEDYDFVRFLENNHLRGIQPPQQHLPPMSYRSFRQRCVPWLGDVLMQNMNNVVILSNRVTQLTQELAEVTHHLHTVEAENRNIETVLRALGETNKTF